MSLLKTTVIIFKLPLFFYLCLQGNLHAFLLSADFFFSKSVFLEKLFQELSEYHQSVKQFYPESKMLTYLYIKIILDKFLLFMYCFLNQVHDTVIERLLESLKVRFMVQSIDAFLFTPPNKIPEILQKFNHHCSRLQI